MPRLRDRRRLRVVICLAVLALLILLAPLVVLWVAASVTFQVGRAFWRSL